MHSEGAITSAVAVSIDAEAGVPLSSSPDRETASGASASDVAADDRYGIRTVQWIARLVKCPKCNAAPGEHCWVPTSNMERRPWCHAERHEEAIRLGTLHAIHNSP